VLVAKSVFCGVSKVVSVIGWMFRPLSAVTLTSTCRLG